METPGELEVGLGYSNTLVHNWKHSQEWQIANIMGLSGNFGIIKSAPFEVLFGKTSTKWLLQLKRNKLKGNLHCVRLELVRDSKADMITAKTVVRVVSSGKRPKEKQDDEVAGTSNELTDLVLEQDLQRTYRRGKRFSCGTFCPRHLADKGYLVDGVLTVTVDFSVFDKVENVEAPVMKLASPSSRLGPQLGAMLDDATFSDFSITTGERTFSVHRNILAARSDVFAKMVGTEMSERRTGQAVVDDIEPDVMEQLLLFIYAGEAPKVNSMALELYAAANKYDLDELRGVCGSKLARTLSIWNICPILKLFDVVVDETDGFKQFVLEYYRKNCAEILETEGWKDLDEENPQLAHSLLRTTILGGRGRKRKRN